MVTCTYRFRLDHLDGTSVHDATMHCSSYASLQLVACGLHIRVVVSGHFTSILISLTGHRLHTQQLSFEALDGFLAAATVNGASVAKRSSISDVASRTY